jgi:hypothetical protein
MKDLISRAWFKRIWTIQELVMAREPIVVCGEKSIRWSNLHWGIWAATKFADDEDSGALSDICDSVLVTEALWLDHHIISEWSESPIKKRLLRGARPESSAFRRRLLEFISDHGWTLVYIQMFGIFLAILTRMYYGLRPLNSLGLLLPILSCIATLVLTPAGLFKDHEQSVRRKIVNILNRTRTRQATEGVDRVFALYGVLQNLGIPLQKPDYEKSVGEVYSEFTRAIISWHKSLDILTEASTPSLPDTPSWVPNWSTRYHRLFKGDSRAAKDSSPRYSFSDCGRRLETSGMVVGTVVYCTEALEEPSGDLFSGGRDSIDPAFLSRSLHNVRVLTQWISYAFQMSNPNHELFSEAIFETVHTETDFAAKDKPHLRQTFKKWYSVLTADYSECHAICSPDIACALVLSMKESLNRYHNERCRAIAGKRIFFVTSNGYIGTGPPFMLNRDKVAILSGLRSPLILRGVGPDHEVVGAAYVHAIMQGEAWSEDKGELLQVTLI